MHPTSKLIATTAIITVTRFMYISLLCFSVMSFLFFLFFFFQAEDGIRDVAVTGVQTCALPISSGYITKSANYMELLSALEEIIRGGAPMSSRIARMVIDNYHINPNSPLTKRETTILQLISEGKTYTQISEELFISKETAKTHIKNIYSKLQVNSKSEAIAKANVEKLI